MANDAETKTLVQCDHCDAVIPVIVRNTGERDPVGTGGECVFGDHAFTFRGERIEPRRNGS